MERWCYADLVRRTPARDSAQCRQAYICSRQLELERAKPTTVATCSSTYPVTKANCVLFPSAIVCVDSCQCVDGSRRHSSRCALFRSAPRLFLPLARRRHTRPVRILNPPSDLSCHRLPQCLTSICSRAFHQDMELS